VIRFRVRRTRQQSFLPRMLRAWERRAWGLQRVLLLVAYGVRANGERQRLALQRAKGESQAGWEGFLHNLRERGLLGEPLQMIITDGCAGWAAALETVYPRALHHSAVGCIRCGTSAKPCAVATTRRSSAMPKRSTRRPV
jgi:transposase-like protein